MRFSATIFILFVFLSSVKSQATFRSEALLSNYSSRSTHFKLYVVGDSIMMASVGRYRVFQWTDYPRLLKTDAQGANVQVFDLNNVNLDCPVGRGTSWTNSKGYLLFSDTTTYAGYKDKTTLSQCFSFHAYGSDSILWNGEGSIYVPYGNGTQITVASNSTFWIDNILSEEFTAVDQLTGDTTLTISYDSIARNYPASFDYQLFEYSLYAPSESNSDSAYGFAHFVKRDSAGNPLAFESYYSLVDLKDLSLLAPPIFWPSEVFYFDPNGFGILKDSIEYYPNGHFYRKTITSERIYNSMIDTVLVLDSLRYHPDTVKFPVHNRHHIFRTKGNFTLYLEEIEQYLDTVQFGQSTIETVLLRMYNGNNLVYEKSLITSNFSGDGDIRIVDAFVLSDGRAILNLNIGARRDGYRILFLDTNGTNYLSIDEQSIEGENTRFDILPNFVDHEIQIKTSAIIKELKIVDAMGRVHLSVPYETMEMNLDVSEFPQGIYYAVARLKNGTVQTRKFIKK